MPIRFTCDACGQKLSVSSRKAGQQGSCPKCHRELTIPESTAPQPEQEPAANAQPADDPYAEFVVYDDPELVYEEAAPGEVEPTRRVDDDFVAVPRRVLYLQGMLLGLVALVSFAFGILVGHGETDSVPSSEPRSVTGALSYQTSRGLELPDEGAVVIALPVDRRPGINERTAVEGLRPSDPLPKESHESLHTIRILGGAYTRSDQTGSYRLRLPAAGEYFFLFMSNNASRSSDQELDKRHLAQMGRYFQRVVDLLGDHRYQWRQASIVRDETMNVRFNR